MRQTPLASTKGELGVHHPDYEDKEVMGFAAPHVKEKKVHFSDLEFGFMANWKRADQRNLASYRSIPEVIGDNPTSRCIVTALP